MSLELEEIEEPAIRSMSATIGMVMEDNSVIQIQVACFGGISHTGYILERWYRYRSHVHELIGLGAILYLERFLFPKGDNPHTSESPQPNVTLSFRRDEGVYYEDEIWDNISNWTPNSEVQNQYMWDEGIWYFWDNNTWSELTADRCNRPRLTPSSR